MSSTTSETHVHQAPHGVVRRWWPAAAALAFGLALHLDIHRNLQPWTPSSILTSLLPVLALVYLVFGLARGQLQRPGVLTIQLAGLVGFGALALLALFLDPSVGHYVVAAGWIGHAIWDVAHHRDLNQNRPGSCPAGTRSPAS